MRKRQGKIKRIQIHIVKKKKKANVDCLEKEETI